MDRRRSYDVPRWYVVHTHPKQETRAENILKAWNVETFTPRLKERHCNQFTGLPVYRVKPLFAQYIFARFNASRLLQKIRFTRGVHDVVSFNNGPTPVDDEIIATIQSQIGDDGFVQMSEQLKVGDRVVIEGGPLRGLAGIFKRGVKDSDRVIILLSAVSYQGRVVTDAKIVRAE